MISSVCLEHDLPKNWFSLFRIMPWLRLPLRLMSGKGRKDCSVAAIYRLKDGAIDVEDVTGRFGKDTDPTDQRE
jgi:hypothetical protein